MSVFCLRLEQTASDLGAIAEAMRSEIWQEHCIFGLLCAQS